MPARELNLAGGAFCAALGLLGAIVAPRPAAAQDNAAAQTELRIDQLQDQVRTMTGQIETEDHQLQVITEQLAKMKADLELRLTDLENKTGGGPASAPADGAAPPPSAAPAAPAQAAGTPVPGAAPHSLGTIPAGSTPAGPPPAAAATAGPTPQQQYQAAFEMVGQGNYGAAEKGFSAFLAQHSKDPLAGSAAYWLAECYYMRGKYQEAAGAFADAYQKYPKGGKAPDTLLDLGRSLDKLNQTANACAAFAQIDAKFPSASPTIKRQTKQEKTRLKCG